MKSINFNLMIGLIVLVCLARLSPHPWNVTPMGALALFAGAYLPGRIGWLVPVFASFIADLYIGLYNPMLMVFVYCAYAAGSVAGSLLLHRRRSVHRIGVAVMAGAAAFFVISNLGPWISFYPHDINGLITCYVNALPFFGRSLLGDAVYAMMLFGMFESIRYLTVRKNTAHGAEK